MDYVIAVIAFVGAWLIVAGPVYQAAIELQEQEFDREAMEATTSTVVAPPAISSWWWLLPPVAWIKQHNRSEIYRRAVFAALGADQLKQTVTFFNKANGWMIVGAGAFLLAINETWLLVRLLEWPVWVLWVTVVVLGIACLLNAAAAMVRNEKILKTEEELAALRAKRARSRTGRNRKAVTPAD
ncbi:MAG: hypothetical protein ABJB03_01960 [Rhodoglobus sp.]